MRGLYRVQERGAWYAFTQFEPIDARRAFPCFDEPGFKTPFDVTLTVPAGSVAFANMKERRRRAGAGRRARALRVRVDAAAADLPGRVRGRAVRRRRRASATDAPGARHRHQGARRELASTRWRRRSGSSGRSTRYFGTPYPYDKLDLVAVPGFGAGAMENAGLLTFREELLLLDARASLAARASASATIIAHELAHQWFGNLVTMAWWDDLWLNEAFATWMADKVVDEWRPMTGARKQALVEQVARHERRRAVDRAPHPQPRAQHQRGAGGVRRRHLQPRARAVLAMTEAWLGEEAFRDGIRRYLSRHAWGSATADDLYAALAEASGGRPVASVMQTFTTQTGFPTVDATLDCAPGRKPAVSITQREYRTLDRKAEASVKLWQLPICLVSPARGRGEARPTVHAARDARRAHRAGRRRWLPGVRVPERR